MAIVLDSKPTSRAATPGRTPGRAPAFGEARVTAKERAQFTEQLCLMLESGNSLQESLAALKEQAAKPAYRKLLEGLSEEIATGKPFSHALAMHPGVFSTTYANVIAAAEEGGFLHAALAQLHEMEEKRAQLNNTLYGALAYPAFLIVFSLTVVVLALLVIFPKFSEMFAAIHDRLPLTTRVLMAVSDVLRNNYVIVLVVTAVLVVGAVVFLRSAAGKRLLDRVKLSAPYISAIFIELYLVNTMRVLGLSLANGVGIVDAIKACDAVADNQVFRATLQEAEGRVKEGQTVSKAFLALWFLPPMVRQMIATGEQTGKLPIILQKIAENYERQLARRLTTLSKIAEPVMLLIMGTAIAVIVISLILPIFKLSSAVH